MKKSLLVGIGTIVLVLSVVLVAWEGAFSLGQFDPANIRQTFIFWATSTLIFVLMVTLGFMLFRELVKLYIARQSDRPGSRIRTKLVLGALTITCLPVFFLVLFSFFVLGHSLQRWFTNPVDQQVGRFVNVARMLNKEMQDEVNAQAALLAAIPETRQLLANPAAAPGFLEEFAKAQEAESAAILPAEGDAAILSWGPYQRAISEAMAVRARAPVVEAGKTIGYAELTAPIPLDVAKQVSDIKGYNDEWIVLHDRLRETKLFYTMLMTLITLFVLFVATWIAMFLAKQISVPITALLDAASEVRKGNFKQVDR